MKTATFSMPFAAQRPTPTPAPDERLQTMEELNRPVSIPTTKGCHLSIPIRITTADQGSMKKIRRRTVGDELADRVAQTRKCPTLRAIRMANALMLERILGTGQFRSPAALAGKLGINRTVISDLLKMLNLPPEEIERILFETK